MAEYDLVLKHKPGTSNRADYLSRPLGVDRSVKNNENVTVLPDQLFARALNLEDLIRRYDNHKRNYPRNGRSSMV